MCVLIVLTSCASSAENGSDAPVIGSSQPAAGSTPTPTAVPTPTAEPDVPEPTAIPEPTPAPTPTAVATVTPVATEPTLEVEPTSTPAPSGDASAQSAGGGGQADEPEDPALREVTGRWAEAGCVNGLVTRTVLFEIEEIREVVEQVPFRVWICPSSEEVLNELFCYVEESEEILVAMETELGQRGIDAANEFRKVDGIFCANPDFS